MKIVLLGYGWGAQSALNALDRINDIDIILLSDAISTSSERYRITNLNDIPPDLDLIICSGFTDKIPIEIINKYKVINIHYSLLPKYRGLHSTVWAILNDEKYLGISLHLMNEYFDDGDLLYQHKFENDFKSTSYEYMLMFNKHIENNLDQVITNFLNGKIKPKKQNKKLASWVPRRKKEDCKIDFHKTISYQKAFFRALVKPYPLPYIEINGKEYLVTKVKFQQVNISSKLGCIVNIDNDGVWITCLDGYIIIQELIEESNSQKRDLNTLKIGKVVL